MELEHFSHDHPLILKIKHMDDDDGVVKISCYACEQLIISGQSYYGCNRCWFFLHKSCTELPKKIVHPSHLEHPLTLFSNPATQEAFVMSVEKPAIDSFTVVSHATWMLT
ncbi:hypothetical protein ACSBR2_017853 [Camellia fascicularis]